MDRPTLFELALAAHYLNIWNLIDLECIKKNDLSTGRSIQAQERKDRGEHMEYVVLVTKNPSLFWNLNQVYSRVYFMLYFPSIKETVTRTLPSMDMWCSQQMYKLLGENDPMDLLE